MRFIIYICLFMLTSVPSSYAVDLNSPPPSKKITVRSEIERGANSVKLCVNLLCMSKAIQREATNNTDTDAFKLGAKFYAWSTADIYGDKALAEAYYGAFSKVQTDYQIGDKALCDMAGLRLESVAPRLSKYRAAP